ncbi:hypothetical protein [Hymenobacter terricola]|uniref:hypothetical protein n=1 Tax=Hymenobacter terricola TaxID=2819236 RepID=UPI001B31417A|nr:hypothetical protein [Hymenobacter terricola]
MREHNKRWLLSKMKTSGSKRKHMQNGSFADERHAKSELPFEELPQFESVKSTHKFYNGKINYGLLVRFLRGKIGNNWDDVYSEIISRIPISLLDYKHMIFWFVADKINVIDGKLWDAKTQKFIWTGGPYILRHYSEILLSPEFREFYVDPITNKLEHIPQKSFKRIAQKLS